MNDMNLAPAVETPDGVVTISTDAYDTRKDGVVFVSGWSRLMTLPKPKWSDFPAEMAQANAERARLNAERGDDFQMPMWEGDETAYTAIKAYPTIDAAWKKFNQQESRMMRRVVTDALRAAGVTGKISVRTDRYAGCSSCPCSPGLRVKVDGYGLTRSRRVTRMVLQQVDAEVAA